MKTTAVISGLFAVSMFPTVQGALVTYYYAGSLTSVIQNGLGPVDSFGTIPVGTPFHGSLSFYNTQSSGGSFYLYSTFEVELGNETLKLGPYTNYAPGYLGSAGPGGNSLANFKDDATSLQFGSGFTYFNIGGKDVGGLHGSPLTIYLSNYSGSGSLDEKLFDSTLSLSDFSSASFTLPEYGTFILPNDGKQRATGEITYFSAVPVPEISSLALLMASCGALAFSRNRRDR